MWEVLATDEWNNWYLSLTLVERERLMFSLNLLRRDGPLLARPHADTIRGSVHPNMRELRTQVGGHPLRSLYAFDPERHAILLCGGDKTGDDRFYDRMIPIADRLFEQHLAELKKRK